MLVELIDHTGGGVMEVNVIRPATREQGRRLAAAYKPGPRQAIPFVTKKRPCKHCDLPVRRVGTTDGGSTWVHVMLNGMWMTTNIDHYAEPRPIDITLWIYLPSTKRWECHKNGSVEIRDYLRAIWRSAGYATAVEV